MNVIGLEVSTSAAKCILFSLEEGVILEKTVGYGKEFCDIATQEPVGIFSAALEALADVVGRTKRKISAIGLGGTWHSLLLLDGNRKPLGRIRTWADHSGATFVNALQRDHDFVQKFYHKTGCMVHPLYPIFKYYYLKKNQPGLVSKTRYLVSQMEYVFQRLTGKNNVSNCIASGSGFFNINTLDWDDELLDFVGVNREQLGELQEALLASPLLPSVAEQVGLPAGLPVTVGAADGALNQIGIGGARKGVMSFSVGTSAAIRLTSDAPQIPSTPSTWCYYLYEGKRLAGAATNGACNCLDWYLDRMTPASAGRDYQGYDQAAEKVNKVSAPFFMPFLFGERCPGWQGEKKGGFMEVSAKHTEFDLYFAVLEGILLNIYHCYRILSKVAREPEEIRISGGIMNSPFWLQMAADIFDHPLLTTGFANDSTVGAALLALQVVGGISKVEDYHPSATGRIDPVPQNVDLYRERFKKYLQLYKQTN